MSLILSGPKRIYVLLLFWERLVDPCATCPRSFARLDRAMGVEGGIAGAGRCASPCQIVVAYRLARVFWRRLIGLTLLVLDPRG